MASPPSSPSSTSQLWQHLWQLASWLEETAEKPKAKVWRRYLRRYTRPAWLMAATLGLTLLSVNTRLVLASGVGVGAAMTVFYLAQKQWILPPFWQGWVEKLNRSRGMAIAAGSTATLSTYAALQLNRPFVDPSLALGLMVEGSLLLGLLLWLSTRPERADDLSGNTADPLEPYLHQLADPDPLKRLLAIRQTSRLVRTIDVPPETRIDLADCFRIMLAQETNPTVQHALVRQLAWLAPSPQLGEGSAPFVPAIASLQQREPVAEMRVPEPHMASD